MASENQTMADMVSRITLEPPAASQPTRSESLQNLYCKICDVRSRSEKAMYEHLASELHGRFAMASLFYMKSPKQSAKDERDSLEPTFCESQQPVSVPQQADQNSTVSEFKKSEILRTDKKSQLQVKKSQSPKKKAPLIQSNVTIQSPTSAPGQAAAAEDSLEEGEIRSDSDSPDQTCDDDNNTRSSCNDENGSDKRISKMKLRPPQKAAIPERHEPKVGWLEDVNILKRRERELRKGYESPAYLRYISAIPKCDRKKNVHPRTPNKYINYSRRSWDTQVRHWRKMLHTWAGMEDNHMDRSKTPSPEPSAAEQQS